jgi:hypothetical protein
MEKVVGLDISIQVCLSAVVNVNLHCNLPVALSKRPALLTCPFYVILINYRASREFPLANLGFLSSPQRYEAVIFRIHRDAFE